MTQTVYEACADAMGDYFREGMKILDYGCGPGFFADHMDKQLNNFTYYGVEPTSKHGCKCIDKARASHDQDHRMFFGYIGENIEGWAIEVAGVALLLSVFTHLDIEQTEEILAKLRPIVDRGGIMVFTMIHGDEYKLGKPGMYSLKKTYSVVYNTRGQVDYLADKFKVYVEKKEEWLHRGRGGTWLHDIYQMKAS